MGRRKPSGIEITPRTKVWLEIDGRYVFGLGICRILEAVDETGSIKDAAAAVGKSYRHVWSRIKEVERDFGLTLVETQVGGADARRSTLTEPARQLVKSYLELRRRAFEFVDETFQTNIRKIVSDAARSAAGR